MRFQYKTFPSVPRAADYEITGICILALPFHGQIGCEDASLPAAAAAPLAAAAGPTSPAAPHTNTTHTHTVVFTGELHYSSSWCVNTHVLGSSCPCLAILRGTGSLRCRCRCSVRRCRCEACSSAGSPRRSSSPAGGGGCTLSYQLSHAGAPSPIPSLHPPRPTRGPRTHLASTTEHYKPLDPLCIPTEHHESH